MKSEYEKTKKFFDRVGSEKKGYFDSPRSPVFFFQEKIKQKALDLIPDQPKSILDAGCGRGDFTLVLANHFPQAEVVGVDFSSAMIRIAVENYQSQNVKFIQADILHLPFPDNSFDVTLCVDTLHIFPQEDFEEVVRELTRVTSTLVILDFRNTKTIFWEPYHFLFRIFNPGLFCSGTDHKAIQELFKKYGFSLEKTFPLFFFSLFSPAIIGKFKRQAI